MVTKRVGQRETKGERERQRQRGTYAQLSRIFAACKANEITAGKRIVRGVESRERSGVERGEEWVGGLATFGVALTGSALCYPVTTSFCAV